MCVSINNIACVSGVYALSVSHMCFRISANVGLLIQADLRLHISALHPGNGVHSANVLAEHVRSLTKIICGNRPCRVGSSQITATCVTAFLICAREACLAGTHPVHFGAVRIRNPCRGSYQKRTHVSSRFSTISFLVGGTCVTKN